MHSSYRAERTALSLNNIMKNKNLKTLGLRLRSLTLFRELLGDPIINALGKCLDILESGENSEKISKYCDFVSLLYEKGGNLSKYLRQAVRDSENVYIRTVGKGEKPAEFLERALSAELCVLEEVSTLSSTELSREIEGDIFLPEYQTEKLSLEEFYRSHIENIGKNGYGIYARYRMFYLGAQNKIVPVHTPDETRLSSLVDYEREQKIILDNTRALLAGKPAANILLTGDAGTGKSSTVKAIVNELYSEGLRIIEVKKDQLHSIAGLLDELGENPLKFILFIDDLSFQRDDDNYSALKAVLEGSVSAKSQNVVIYATSNRRHIVKEKFSDREGDDIHRNDTMQEMVSLSERFGIHVTFKRPDKQTYLDIVRHLALEAGINDMAEDEIDALAEQYALGRGGRSARAARQFVDGLVASVRET